VTFVAEAVTSSGRVHSLGSSEKVAREDSVLVYDPSDTLT